MLSFLLLEKYSLEEKWEEESSSFFLTHISHHYSSILDNKRKGFFYEKRMQIRFQIDHLKKGRENGTVFFGTMTSLAFWETSIGSKNASFLSIVLLYSVMIQLKFQLSTLIFLALAAFLKRGNDPEKVPLLFSLPFLWQRTQKSLFSFKKCAVFWILSGQIFCFLSIVV